MERRQSEVGSAFEKMCETHILSFSRLVYLYLPVTVPSRLPKAPGGLTALTGQRPADQMQSSD